jgi:hypothetical protein
MLLILAASPWVKGKPSNNQSNEHSTDKNETKCLCGNLCSGLARSLSRERLAVVDADYSLLDAIGLVASVFI